MLTLTNVTAAYTNLEVLHSVSIEVNEGEIVTIIGANGAGKSTTLKAISGLLAKKKGSVIRFDGRDITTLGTEKIVSIGLALVPEGRRVFPDMSVLDNLEMGAYLRHKDRPGVEKDLELVYSLFPILKERKKQLSKTLSGGEQQMLAIARSLMSNPKLLMLDEPSTGLAPLVVQEIFRIIKRLNSERGITVLLVEQNAKMALSVADRGYVLKNGEIILSDTGANLLDNQSIREAYLGENIYKNED
ncbi:MAG: ABC transporter ATP-binding protein [Acetanaerobacterium sp.]